MLGKIVHPVARKIYVTTAGYVNYGKHLMEYPEDYKSLLDEYEKTIEAMSTTTVFSPNPKRTLTKFVENYISQAIKECISIEKKQGALTKSQNDLIDYYRDLKSAYNHVIAQNQRVKLRSKKLNFSG